MHTSEVAERLLRFVKRVQQLGFSLDEAEELVHLGGGGPRACDRRCSLLDALNSEDGES